MKLLYFLLSVASTTCFHLASGDSEASKEKVVVSKPAKIVSFPHQASFEYDGKFKFGATIISKTHLISAAHFFTVYTDYLKRGTIRTGTSEKERGGHVFRIKKVMLHPDFNSDMFENDLAIVWLTTPIKFNRNQKAIGLPKPYNYDLTGKQMLFSGFGQVEGTGASDVLKAADLTVISHDECLETFEDIEPKQKVFCTTEGPCNGDAGGAVIYKNQLYGIVSIAESCFFPNQPHPAVMTKLEFYYSWIAKYVELKI